MSSLNNLIDSCYPEVVIADVAFSASRILKQMDPIAYNEFAYAAGFDPDTGELLVDMEAEVE